MRQSSLRAWGVVVLAGLLVACQGGTVSVQERDGAGSVHGGKDGRPTGPTDPGGGGGTDGGGGDVVTEPGVCDTTPATPVDAPMRVLSELELNNALGELFEGVDVGRYAMTRDGRVGPFVINGREAVEAAHVEDFRLMAEAVSPIVAQNVDAVLACDAGGAGLFAGESTGTDIGYERFDFTTPKSVSAIDLVALGNDTDPSVLNNDGRQENGWTSIFEVRFYAGNERVDVAGVTATSTEGGNGPERMIDGDETTRWATHGRQVATFQLAREAQVDRVEILWFLADRRKVFFELRENTGGALSERACAEQFVERFVGKAFRRDVQAAERDAFMGLYDEGVASGGRAEGVRWVVEAALQAPSFMYVHEDASQGARELDDYEIASRMAATLWRSIPDDALVEAASQGLLRDADSREAQARRMLEDPRAQRAMRDLVLQWFGVDQLDPADLVTEDADLTEAERVALAGAMLTETEKFVDHVIANEGADWRELLTARYSFVDATMAAHYGVTPVAEPDADGWSRVEWADRAGLLGHASFLAGHHGPVHRGLFVRNAILCGAIPGPEGVSTDTIPTEPGESDRSKSIKRMEHTDCRACHLMMDNLGLTMDTFDGLGRWRQQDAYGNPVESSGEILNTGEVDGPVADSVEMAASLASSDVAAACLSRNLFLYTYARTDGGANACAVETARAQLEATGDIRDALVALIRMDTFVRIPGGAQ